MTYVPPSVQLDLIDWLATAPHAPPETRAAEPDLCPSPVHLGPIADFGEKIAAAKKDLWRDYRRSLAAVLPSDDLEITLTRHFPEPNYPALIADGVSVPILAAIRALRECVPSKPQRVHRVRIWADKLRTVSDFATRLLDGAQSLDALLHELKAGGPDLYGVATRIQLYDALGYPAFTKARSYDIASNHYTLLNGERFDPPRLFHVVTDAGRPIAYEDTYEDALTVLLERLDAPAAPAKGPSFNIYRITATGDIVVGKKIAAKKFIDLKTGFSSPNEARRYLSEHRNELAALLERKRGIPPERRSVNDPRVGPDFRRGDDVLPDAFLEAFGLRGVQFGNYVEQSRRVADLNDAFDALTDLARVLGLPTRAIGLLGTLGLAFGARGGGTAHAHYDTAHTVINLTKTKGAGSLAHEWWHAYDNYLGRSPDHPERYATQDPRASSARVNLPLSDLTRAIFASPYLVRSRQIDRTRIKDYWSTTIELTARAFETYVIDRLAANGQSNDYLANILSEQSHAVQAKILGVEHPYPYPTADERPAINTAFDAIFDPRRLAGRD